MSVPASGIPDLGRALMLEYPQSVAIYDTYADAQKAVDYLADHQFPVEQIVIVGTELKTIERVTGRRTWGNVLSQGAVSGLFMGVMVGLLGIFIPGSWLASLLAGLAFGILFGMANAALTYGMSRGRRDFNSVRDTIASKYEVLAEHKVAQQARDMLVKAPGEWQRQYSGQSGVQQPPTQYPPTQQ